MASLHSCGAMVPFISFSLPLQHHRHRWPSAMAVVPVRARATAPLLKASTPAGLPRRHSPCLRDIVATPSTSQPATLGAHRWPTPARTPICSDLLSLFLL
uniref:Uncharacterized protein n=1 Tax=Arundo donax TaxID=35708 RepID=A0A0A9BWI5_ARUDO